MTELRKCSRCHSTKLEEYFSLNNKGELYKLCNNCRKKQRTEIAINVARQKYLNNIIECSKGDYEYLGIIDPDNVDFPTDKFGDLKGDEVTVEYHSFYDKSLCRPVINRWKLHFTDDPKAEHHKHRGGIMNKSR